MPSTIRSECAPDFDLGYRSVKINVYSADCFDYPSSYMYTTFTARKEWEYKQTAVLVMLINLFLTVARMLRKLY